MINTYLKLKVLGKWKQWLLDIKYYQYTYTEFEKARDELPKDERGLIKDCKHVYLDNDLIDKIDDFLSEVNYLLDYQLIQMTK